MQSKIYPHPVAPTPQSRKQQNIVNLSAIFIEKNASLVEFIMSWVSRWIEEHEYGEFAPFPLILVKSAPRARHISFSTVRKFSAWF